jgi:hypothetical protein
VAAAAIQARCHYRISARPAPTTRSSYADSRRAVLASQSHRPRSVSDEIPIARAAPSRVLSREFIPRGCKVVRYAIGPHLEPAGTPPRLPGSRARASPGTQLLYVVPDLLYEPGEPCIGHRPRVTCHGDVEARELHRRLEMVRPVCSRRDPRQRRRRAAREPAGRRSVLGPQI